jgi:hypothetical protein
MRRLLLSLPFLALAFAACSSSSSGDAATSPGPQPQPTKPPGESPASREKEKDPSTKIVVGVDAEDFRSQGFVIGVVKVTVKVDGLVAADETLDAAGKTVFPHEVSIAAPKDRPEAAVEISVAASDGGTEVNDGRPPIVTKTVTTRFVKGKTKLAYVFLEVRCNTFPLAGGFNVSGPTCTNPGETCAGGKCRSNALGELPDYSPDWAKNPPSACGAGTASTVVLAKGESDVTPIVDDETLQIEAGPQCGHHLWLGVRMKDLAQQGTTTIVSATQPGSAIAVPATAVPYAYGPAADGTCELAGIRFQVDGSGAKAADFLGKPLDIKLEAKDKAGRAATVTKRVKIAPTFKGDYPYCNNGGGAPPK